MYGCCKQSMLYLTEHTLDIALHHIVPSTVSTLLILSLKEKSYNSYVSLYLIALEWPQIKLSYDIQQQLYLKEFRDFSVKEEITPMMNTMLKISVFGSFLAIVCNWNNYNMKQDRQTLPNLLPLSLFDFEPIRIS